MRNENTCVSPTTNGCNQLSNIKPIGLSTEALAPHINWLLNDRHHINDNLLKNTKKSLDKKLARWQLSSGLLNRDPK